MAALEFYLRKTPIVICRIVNDAATLVDKSFGAAACGVAVVHVGFAVGSIGKLSFPIFERVSTDHHAKDFPGIEIPSAEGVSGGTFVKFLPFAFAHVVLRQFIEFAEVRRHGIL